MFSYKGELFSGIIEHYTNKRVVISPVQHLTKAWKGPIKPNQMVFSWDKILGCIKNFYLCKKCNIRKQNMSLYWKTRSKNSIHQHMIENDQDWNECLCCCIISLRNGLMTYFVLYRSQYLLEL